jgi:hypothetical protein
MRPQTGNLADQKLWLQFAAGLLAHCNLQWTSKQAAFVILAHHDS